MNPNPGEPPKHGQEQRKDPVSERGPQNVRLDVAAILERDEEKAKEKKAEIVKTKRTRLWILGACLLALALVLGILYIQSGGLATLGVKPRQLSPTEKQLKGIAALYRGYGAAFGKPPPNMQALKAWGEKLDKQKLAHFEIDNVETLFVSERDGQPFVLVQLPRGIGPVLAHEKVGAQGTRLVISSVGSVEEMDEARFQQAMETNRMIGKAPKGH